MTKTSGHTINLTSMLLLFPMLNNLVLASADLVGSIWMETLDAGVILKSEQKAKQAAEQIAKTVGKAYRSAVEGGANPIRAVVPAHAKAIYKFWYGTVITEDGCSLVSIVEGEVANKMQGRTVWTDSITERACIVRKVE